MFDSPDMIYTAPGDGVHPSFAWDSNGLHGRVPASLALDAALLPTGPPESAPCDEGQWRISISPDAAGRRFQLELWWDNVASRPYDLLFEVSLVWDGEREGSQLGYADQAQEEPAPPAPGSAPPVLRVLCGPSRIESTFGWAKYDLGPERLLSKYLKHGSPSFRLRVACPSLEV